MEQESMRWYIIHTYSGYEEKVKESLEQRFEALGKGDLLGQVLIPTESVMELKNGKKVVTTKKLFPGYIYVQMLLTDDGWHVVKNTPRVTGFVGGRNPAPLTDSEIDNILNQVQMAQEKPKPKYSFDLGEKIKIIDGPFLNFIGNVDEVNQDKGTLKVMVTIFGRSTPVELSFHEVEKI
ncbi:MAG: transcription termination/antitermination factor NusG [Acidobacteria bacterium]|nr:transcription termination/antitermination factor NusG [Acidobacteriota bacterium]MCB9396895.1 transcription termination/antitermination factor NusG [Acidobacteriota bacterium]